MITVEVKLHSAITGKVKLLGSMTIVNDGRNPDHPRRGNYEALVRQKRTIRKATVRDYPRLSYNVWRLVLRSLALAYPEDAKWIGSNTTKTNETHSETGDRVS